MKKIIQFFCLLASIFAAQSLFAQMNVSYMGEVSNADTINRPVAACDALSGNLTGYSVVNVSVDAEGKYSVESDQEGFDGFLFIYEFAFDSVDPLSNCIAANDDDDGNINRSKIDGITLFPDTNYAIVVAGFSNADVGTYINTISGPGNIGLATTILVEGSTVDTNRFNRQIQSCDAYSGTGTNTEYSVQPFTVGLNGHYSFAQVQDEYDGLLHIYDDRFNPMDSALGCLAGNDDGPEGIGSSQILDVRLAADHTYYLVSSGFANDDAGPFRTFINGPGDILIGSGNISLARLSGIWYDPALDGSGFNVVARRNGIIFTFFGYLDGVQRWLISELITSEIRQGQTYEAVMFIGEMGELNNPAPGNNLPVFGTLEFNFLACGVALAELAGEGAYAGLQQTYDLTLLLQATGLNCD